MFDKYKALIAPIIAVIAMFVQMVFGVEIKADTQNDIVVAVANVIAVGIVVYGIFHNNVKPTKKDTDANDKEA
jgi:uncharacterized membrane protein